MKLIYSIILAAMITALLTTGIILAMFFTLNKKPPTIIHEHITVHQKGTEEHFGGDIRINERGKPEFGINFGETVRR